MAQPEYCVLLAADGSQVGTYRLGPDEPRPEAFIMGLLSAFGYDRTEGRHHYYRRLTAKSVSLGQLTKPT